MRYEDASPFFAISDRISLKDFNDDSIELFRGDCYICNFTHRINRNFQDPSAPNADIIVDEKCWKENYKPKTAVEDLNKINIGDLNVIINDLNTSDELINSVNNMDIVEKVDVINSVAGGININGTVERSNVFFTEYAPDKHPFKVYDDSLNKFVKDPLPLEEGEIYVPISFVDLYECEIGDKITLSFNEESKTFSIKAFIEEPLMGTSSIGIKMVFINNNDFNNLYKKRYIESDDSSISDENVLIGWNIVCIDKDKGNDMSMGQFKKEVNNSTQIIDLAFSSLSKEQSINYTSMFVNLISGIMYVFIIILFIATLIVMGHSITSTIEMDYVNLGILKSQGFTKRALRMYFLYQYFLAEGIGIILGIIGSLFFIPYLNKVFLSLTGLLASNKIAIFELIVFLIFIITISTIFIIIVCVVSKELFIPIILGIILLIILKIAKLSYWDSIKRLLMLLPFGGVIIIFQPFIQPAKECSLP